MITAEYKMKAKVWVYPGFAAWRFLSVPIKQTKEITKVFGALKRGWGSLPVLATIGKTSWKTSIFPDKKTQTFLLPVKKDVREKEGIIDDKITTFSIKILV